MKPLLILHCRAGVRVAVRAAAPIVCLLVAAVVVQDRPAALIVAWAAAAFSEPPRFGTVAPLLALAIWLPLRAVPRLAAGANGWLRHLPVDDVDRRRALTAGVVTAQFPLVLVLAGLASIASREGLSIYPVVRWMLIVTAAAMASVPSERRRWAALLCSAALLVGVAGSHATLLFGVVFMAVADRVAGPIRRPHTHSLRATDGLLQWRVAWRALGRHLLRGYAMGLVVLGGGWLFIVNNALTGWQADAVARMAGALASASFIVSLSNSLTQRRPAWALARSWPWSAMRRVGEDGVFLACHTLPFPLLIAAQSRSAALAVLSALPLLSLRGAGRIRRVATRGAPFVLAMEGVLIAALLALLPLTVFAWPLGAVPVLYLSAERDRRMRVTRWSEQQYHQAADPALPHS